MLNKNDINLMLVYYADEMYNVNLDIIKDNKIINTYNNISSISGNVVTSLVSKYDSFYKPFIIMIKNQSLFLEKDRLNWALFSNDKLFNEIKITSNNNGLNERKAPQDACWTCAGDNGSDCNMWSPGLCGDICQMRTSAKAVQDNQSTNAIGTNLFNLFPNLYSVKDIFDDSKSNKHLADNFYNLGSFSFSNQMNVPFTLHLQFANIILANSDKITLFIDPQSKTSSEILFTNTEAQEYLNFIQNVRTVMNGYDSNSNPLVLPQVKSDFNLFLDSFENAIIEFQNKTLNEIHLSI
ncbi:MAG: hypothetical protein COA67_02735 [Lutibacter sp.]|nr:MAG: hypothetical protein COA67_02735 [Lutibacter sp.]